MAHVVVVGAGISGLTCALRLQELVPTAVVELLESTHRAGGTIWTVREQGYQIETGPNGFLDSKPSTLELCRQLGLSGDLIPASEAASRNRFLFLGGRLKRLPDSLGAFLRSDLLSWRGKLSLLAERFRPARKNETDESVRDFVRRRAGLETADVLADALVTGIHAGDPALLSVSAAFPRLAELEKTDGSILKGMVRAARERRRAAAGGDRPVGGTGRMWSLRGGLRSLIEAIQGRLARPIRFGAAVRRIGRSGKRCQDPFPPVPPTSDSAEDSSRLRNSAETGPDTFFPAPGDARPAWKIEASDGETWQADAVVLACPAFTQSAILADADPVLAGLIEAIPYNRLVVVALAYRRSDVPGLDGFGYIAPQRLRRDVLGVQWCSSIFPDRAPTDHVLLRAMCGGWNRPEMVDWDDRRLLTAIREELSCAMGIRSEPEIHWIVRWPRAIPQYHLGHGQRLASIEARLRDHAGLFLAGNAYRGVSLNDCTEQAARLAERVAVYLNDRA